MHTLPTHIYCMFKLHVKVNFASDDPFNTHLCLVIRTTNVVLPLELFHFMVRHGTVRYGSLLGGFPLGTLPGTW